jgi:nucleotide-binding universal stress UspA family protein
MSVTQRGVGRQFIPTLQAELSAEGDSIDFGNYLDEVSTELQRTGISSESSVTIGDAAEEITARLEQGDIDLLVLTTHGRSGVARVLMGSVADEVIQQASIPVLLIRPFGKQESEPLSFKKVLVALDGSAEAELSLPYAAAFGKRFNSRLLLLTVPDDLASSSQINNLQNYLNCVSDNLANLDLTTETTVVGTDPGYTILELAESEQADMIMLATHGRGDRERFMIGSVADTVLTRSSCPVFLVPIRIKSDADSECRQEPQNSG